MPGGECKGELRGVPVGENVLDPVGDDILVERGDTLHDDVSRHQLD